MVQSRTSIHVKHEVSCQNVISPEHNPSISSVALLGLHFSCVEANGLGSSLIKSFPGNLVLFYLKKQNKCMASSPCCVSSEGPFLSTLYNTQRLRTSPVLLSPMLSVKNVWPVFGQGTSFRLGWVQLGLALRLACLLGKEEKRDS